MDPAFRRGATSAIQKEQRQCSVEWQTEKCGVGRGRCGEWASDGYWWSLWSFSASLRCSNIYSRIAADNAERVSRVELWGRVVTRWIEASRRRAHRRLTTATARAHPCDRPIVATDSLFPAPKRQPAQPPVHRPSRGNLIRTRSPGRASSTSKSAWCSSATAATRLSPRPLPGVVRLVSRR